MRLLYFAPYSHGGLADYTQAQADALGKKGVEVTILCRPTFADERSGNFVALPRLKETDVPSRYFPKKLAHFSRILEEMKQFDLAISEFSHHHVLLSFSEYLAPLWSQRLQKHADRGVRFGAIVHDPVRDFVVGPKWWHRLSIRKAYSFLSQAFIHEPIDLETGDPYQQLTTTVIPHGIYSFSPSTMTREEARASLDIPEKATVLLSFGHIRDGKNLDLIIESLQSLDNCYLIVAGKEQSSGQRPLSWYQKLAQSLGVDSRCRWISGHVPDSEVANLFIASDISLLTYSSSFRSASGVLAASSFFRVPCVGSGGDGPLKSDITKYKLGPWAHPDDLDALVEALKLAVNSPPQPEWDLYESDHSWETNAKQVAEILLR